MSALIAWYRNAIQLSEYRMCHWSGAGGIAGTTTLMRVRDPGTCPMHPPALRQATREGVVVGGWPVAHLQPVSERITRGDQDALARIRTGPYATLKWREGDSLVRVIRGLSVKAGPQARPGAASLRAG